MKEEEITRVMNEKKFVLNNKALCNLSMILDKMGIAQAIIDSKVTFDDNGNIDKQDLYNNIIALFISNYYKAEKETTQFIADYKGITYEEAENIEVIPVLTELFSNNTIQSFLK